MEKWKVMEPKQQENITTSNRFLTGFAIYRFVSLFMLSYILLFDIYLVITNTAFVPQKGILLVIGIFLMIFFRNIYFLFIGSIVFLWGTLDSIFLGIESAEPTIWQFTAAFSTLLGEPLLRRIVLSISDYFYFISFLLFVLALIFNRFARGGKLKS